MSFTDKTISMLQPLIGDKPPLEDKFLRKPPFRYLQIIIGALISKTGYAKGLFTKEEIVNKEVTAEEKVTFLLKIITVVGISLSKIVPVRPKLIIAGEEPENTNKFLQMLAHAAKNQDKLPVPWKKAVAIVQSGKFPDVTADRLLKKKEAEAKQEPKPDTQNDTTAESRTESKSSKAKEDNSENQERERREKLEREKQDRERQERERQMKEREAQERKARALEEQKREEAIRKAEERKQQIEEERRARELQRHAEEASEQVEMERPTSNRQPSGRPQTARKGPIQSKTNERPITREDTDHVITAQGIIGDDEESEDVIVHVEASEPVPKTLSSVENDEAGGLMQQLQKKTEAQQDQIISNQPREVQEQKPKTKGVILKRKADKSADDYDEIEKLRKYVQVICANSDPLGKNLDYIQEDLEAMTRELSVWTKERKTYMSKLAEEKAKTEQQLKSLKNSISEVEDQIRDKLEKIQATKAQILKNDEQRYSMLLSVIGRD